ncbi:serine/threonine protein kinase Sgk2 [Histoplasma ohiense]|nr:serine/threonine protein kinase Sgk2 [Histoplasma ohiense (nom. inval.)]
MHMAELSDRDCETIAKHPLTNSLNDLNNVLREAEEIYESHLISYDGTDDSLDQLYRNALSKLVITLQGEVAAYCLSSPVGNGDVASDLADLFKTIRRGNFRYDHYRPLICLVIQRHPATEASNVESWNVSIWQAVLNLIITASQTTPPVSPATFENTPVKPTSSSQKDSEQARELVDRRVFEEICSCTFLGVEGFFDKYFEGKDWSSKADAICQRVLASDSDGNWARFPDPPTQSDVLMWWFRFQEDLLSESRSIYYTTESKADLAGSNAERQVNLLLKASSVHPPLQETSHNWKDILAIGELKKSEGEIRTKKTLLQMSCYVREVFIAQPTRRFVHAFVVCGTKMEAWVFDRSGPYSSGFIDVYENSKQFFQVLVGYTMMSDEELGLDTFITRNENGSKSITIKESRGSEEMVLQLGKILSLQHSIVCCGTTCFLTNNKHIEGVVKFSWVSDKRRPEVELLELADQKNVQGVARVISHSTITNISDLRSGLIFHDKRHNFKRTPSSTTSSIHSQALAGPYHLDIHPKSSSRKRKFSGKVMKASKRLRSADQQSRDTQGNELTFSIESVHQPSLFDRNDMDLYDNRILSCLVISPTGRPIYDYKSHLELLTALRDAIKAHQSLYLNANILHRDISENNIIITNPEKTNGHSGMLIDLDLAKEVGSGRSGARHRTGTMEFMAIEVLLNIDHTYRHDLESFFYVLIWQCIRRGWEKLDKLQRQGQPEESALRDWYTGTYQKIARSKRGDMSVDGFEDILSEFPPIFECVKPLCIAIRDILFPYKDRRIIVGTPHDPKRLYNPIIKAYNDAISSIGRQK